MRIIDVENLSFAYAGSSVLEDISFSVEEGEFIGIFGPNGGGKSTLLALLMGFLKPQKGSVRLFGRSPREGRDNIGWVPQNFHFDRHFPIAVSEVVLGGRMHRLPWHGLFSKADHQEVEAVLERVGMRGFDKEPFATLSGGQMQRVLIARALVSKPTLLLLDEPTASVDPTGRKELYEILLQLEKMTIVMVTHDLSSAVKYSDRLFCVQTQLTVMPRERVCEHFALGLYHK